MTSSQESFTFTVGKLDAGMAILLGERAHLIEFPSILLPPGAGTGSIVNIAVHQNHAEEKRRDKEFWSLQSDILESFGRISPEPPKLELRNVTQTSVTLEWPPIQLATAKLRSLDIYRNGQRLAAIPAPTTNTSTKLSGLELDTEYGLQLVLRTTAGTFPSNLVRVRTHTMQNTSGISVCFGNVQDPDLLEAAKDALKAMHARWSDKIQIDTTHFVCTTAAPTPSGAQATGNATSAPGVEYQRAMQLSIPILTPHWVLACQHQRKMVPIGSYYLGSSPEAPLTTPSFQRPQSLSMSQTSPSPTRTDRAANRQSMPVPARQNSGTPPTQLATYKPTPNGPLSPESRARTSAFEPTPEDDEEQQSPEAVTLPSTNAHGKMNTAFKFPPTPTLADPPAGRRSPAKQSPDEGEGLESVGVVAPASVEVPPPPPVEKDRTQSVDEGEEEVGMTEEIDLN